MATDYLIVFAVTLLCSAALVLSQHWHGHFSMDTAFGVQNHRTEPTPCIGGVVIALAPAFSNSYR